MWLKAVFVSLLLANAVVVSTAVVHSMDKEAVIEFYQTSVNYTAKSDQLVLEFSAKPMESNLVKKASKLARP